jgi:hypothetical protein
MKARTKRRTEEQSLEQAVTPGCELGVVLAARAFESNAMPTTQGAGIKSQGAIRTRSTRIRAEAAAKPRKRTTSRKKTTVRMKSTGNSQPLKNQPLKDQPLKKQPLKNQPLKKKKAAGPTNASDEPTTTVGQDIRMVEAELPEQAWPLAGNQCSEVETGPHSNSETIPTSEMSPAMDCALEPVVLDRNINIVDAQLSVPESMPEGSLIERPQSRELRWEMILRWMTGAWKFMRKQLASRQLRKRLRVCESVSLGEKRFVAVIEVDGEQFLVGGASGSVTTLAHLEPTQEFSEVLKRRWAQEPVQA